MKVLVLGAGVIGTTAAYFLARDGHAVTVVDRRAAPGEETSFANGGQLSASGARPWANPGVPRLLLSWLGKPDAPLVFRPRVDPVLWRWTLSFLANCLPARTEANSANILRLAFFSRTAMASRGAAAARLGGRSRRSIGGYWTLFMAWREGKGCALGLPTGGFVQRRLGFEVSAN